MFARNDGQKSFNFIRYLNSPFDWFRRFRRREQKMLFFALRHSKTTLIFSGVFVIVSIFLFARIPKDFLGSVEQNKFTIFIEMPTGTKLDTTNEIVAKVEQIVAEIPEVKMQNTRVKPWSSRIYVELVPDDQRKRSTRDIIEVIRAKAAYLNPAFIHFDEEEQIGTKEITVELYGYEPDVLRLLAMQVARRLENIRGLSDVKIRMREGRPEMQVLVDKDAAALFDISTQNIADQIHGGIRGLRATLFRTDGKEVETITRLKAEDRQTFRDVHKLILSSREGGEPFLLEQVAKFKFEVGASEVWRKNKRRMVQVSARLGNLPLSRAAELVEKNLSRLAFHEDYFYKIGGDYNLLIRSQQEMKLVGLLVIFLVYLVIASLFENLLQALLILSAIPFALGGAVLFLMLGPRTINISAFLGLMVLAGIVVNHLIILVDRINDYRKKNFSPLRAVMAANRDRLRPIMMTSVTTIIGLIPMAIGRGGGSQLWSSLALTVIGGLLSSLILSLVVTPSFYLSALKFGRVFSDRLGRLFEILKIKLALRKA